MADDITRFEDFELDRGAFELRRKGRPLRLERIPLELLFLLTERPGQLVGREEILERVWGKDVFVDVDTSINTAVRKIRQALGDNPDQPRFIQTVPGKGYRFAAAVAAPPAAPESKDSQVEAVPVQPSPPRRMRTALVWIVVAAVAIGAYATIRLRRRSDRATTGRPVLVVLPFVNLSGDPQQEYFADGMTEEMIAQLGNLDPPHLGVIARTSSMQFKDKKERASQISEELGANYLLEGSVRRDGDRVRVTAQLIRASDETHLWAGDFDQELKDVLRLQRDVALAISNKIALSLEGPARSRLTEAPPLIPEAHEAYLQGLHAFNLRTKPGMQSAMAEFQKAIQLDPKYVAAYAALARTYSLATVTGSLPVSEAIPKARQAALQAIALDDSSSEAHTVLGFVKAHYEFDWPGAEKEYRRGLELNANDAYAHLFYSNSYLSPWGRHDEAIAEMKEAIALDPFSAPVQSFLGRTYIWARQYDDALEQFNKCASLFPGFALDHERLSHAYAYRRRFDEAITEETKARLLAGEDSKVVLNKEEELRKAIENGGPYGYWKKLLERSQEAENPPEAYVGSYGQAMLYSWMGDKERALTALEQAFNEHILAMTEIGVEPAFDPIREEPRFQKLLQRVGLAK